MSLEIIFSSKGFISVAYSTLYFIPEQPAVLIPIRSPITSDLVSFISVLTLLAAASVKVNNGLFLLVIINSFKN